MCETLSVKHPFTTPTEASSRLSQLPSELLRKIFEYDNTYQTFYGSEVLPELWQKVWTRWYNSLDCPYKELTMDWLFRWWGVYDGDSVWSRNYYFPSNINVITEFVRYSPETNVDNLVEAVDWREVESEMGEFKCLVSVYINHLPVFRGEILTRQQATVEAQKETTGMESMWDVHADLERGLVLCQCPHD